eukprot:TRINITY_DN20623_c0_g1_i1.p2 TRINITY_DN20623_c0_g1~~TRINITY_DN20623_c0_g1_i1.p2  ORF type:complete len:101 (+),score=10.09 TRINITY_DN20623_c0_g1_i1:106-408(+)
MLATTFSFIGIGSPPTNVMDDGSQIGVSTDGERKHIRSSRRTDDASRRVCGFHLHAQSNPFQLQPFALPLRWSQTSKKLFLLNTLFSSLIFILKSPQIAA